MKDRTKELVFDGFYRDAALAVTGCDTFDCDRYDVFRDSAEESEKLIEGLGVGIKLLYG